ncbi:MAG: pyridoxamine 5'-phosphate oxidase family protein [Rhizobiaceae bacterium]
MARAFAEIAFTTSVLDTQKQQGSAESYTKFLEPDVDKQNRLSRVEVEFIEARDGFYQATVSKAGWPYVQFRGGPRGFVKVLDDQTIAYADFRGNRQYVSTGNLKENKRISLILMDYPNRRRLKIWGRVTLVEAKTDPDLIANLKSENYRALPERAVIIKIEAFDWNCPQHIPQRLTLEELEPHLSEMREQIARLSKENETLKAALKSSS